MARTKARMARTKVRFSPPGRNMHSAQQRLGGRKNLVGPELIFKKQDGENCPPNLDYNVIEQIANGVEKMILSWGHPEEGEGETNDGYYTGSVLEDAEGSTAEKKCSTTWTLPQIDEVRKDNLKTRPTEISNGFHKDIVDNCDYLYPIQIQELRPESAEIPEGLTAEISLDGNCPGAGMDMAISKIVTEAVRHRIPCGSGTILMGDTLSEKTVTKTATYWYLEASNGVSNKRLSVCTEEETNGFKAANIPEKTKENEPTSQTCSPKKALENHSSVHKNKVSGQSVMNHESPRTPPIRERSGKRVQCDPDSSKKKMQLCVSKKTKRSEIAHPLLPTPPPRLRSQEPTLAQNNPEDEEFLKSPTSDSTLLESRSECSWNDPLGNQFSQELAACSAKSRRGEIIDPLDHDLCEGLGYPACSSPVNDIEPLAVGYQIEEKKSSFVSFKLWNEKKQSEYDKESQVEVDPGKEGIVPSIAKSETEDVVDNNNDLKCISAESTPVQLPPRTADDAEQQSRQEVDDLQIALLECATEYEIKTIEMKMRLNNIKAQPVTKELLMLGNKSKTLDTLDEMAGAVRSTAIVPTFAIQPGDREVQRVELIIKQVLKLQRQKGVLTKELTELKNKEMLFETQKRSLDAALLKVNRLQRELVKKEQEVLDWQLHHKHTEAQLEEAQIALQRASPSCELTSLPMRTSSLLSMMSTLRSLLLTINKLNVGASSDAHTQQEALGSPHHIDAIVSSLSQEIQELQQELNRMACKQKQLGPQVDQGIENNRGSNRGDGYLQSQPISRPLSHTSRVRYQYGKF